MDGPELEQLVSMTDTPLACHIGSGPLRGSLPFNHEEILLIAACPPCRNSAIGGMHGRQVGDANQRLPLSILDTTSTASLRER
jgi:hypothetical protein